MANVGGRGEETDEGDGGFCSRTKTCPNVKSLFKKNKLACEMSDDRLQEEKKLINDESVVFYHSRQPLFGK